MPGKKLQGLDETVGITQLISFTLEAPPALRWPALSAIQYVLKKLQVEGINESILFEEIILMLESSGQRSGWVG